MVSMEKCLITSGPGGSFITLVSTDIVSLTKISATNLLCQGKVLKTPTFQLQYKNGYYFINYK